jgi:hypothetical protein
LVATTLTFSVAHAGADTAMAVLGVADCDLPPTVRVYLLIRGLPEGTDAAPNLMVRMPSPPATARPGTAPGADQVLAVAGELAGPLFPVVLVASTVNP